MKGYRLDAFRVQQGSLLRLFLSQSIVKKEMFVGNK